MLTACGNLILWQVKALRLKTGCDKPLWFPWSCSHPCQWVSHTGWQAQQGAWWPVVCWWLYCSSSRCLCPKREAKYTHTHTKTLLKKTKFCHDDLDLSRSNESNLLQFLNDHGEGLENWGGGSREGNDPLWTVPFWDIDASATLHRKGDKNPTSKQSKKKTKQLKLSSNVNTVQINLSKIMSTCLLFYSVHV